MKLNRKWVWGGVLLLAALVAALLVVVPLFIRARCDSCERACINNLRIMNAGKEQAAVDQKWLLDANCDDLTQTWANLPDQAEPARLPESATNR